MNVDDHPEYPIYYEAVKELHTLSSHELRRLAMRYADYFSVGFHETEVKPSPD
jgi:exportin-5